MRSIPSMRSPSGLSRPFPLPERTRASASPILFASGTRQAQPGSTTAMLAILQLAARIEPDSTAVLEWYRSTPIKTLDGQSAEQLVAGNRAAEVIDFLTTICREMLD